MKRAIILASWLALAAAATAHAERWVVPAGAHVTDFVRWALGDNPGFSASAPGGDADGRITLLLAHGELLYGVDGTEFHARESDDVTACDQPQLVFQP